MVRPRSAAPARQSPVKSAARVIEVLEYFRDTREPSTLKQISDALGYPQSSTTMLLKSLAALGYLNYDTSARRYFPTLLVSALGDWIGHALLGHTRIVSALQELHAATGETVSIALQNDIWLQYVHVLQSVHPLRFHTDEGSQRLLVQSALGWLLLSSRSDAEAEQLIRRANQTLSGAERVSVDDMLQRVKGLRASPLVYAENMPLLGGATLCTLLALRVQGRPVVLGLGGAIDRIRQHRDSYEHALRRAVESVHDLGTGDSTARPQRSQRAPVGGS
jgi:DNA-binding IclR family transcriptional regulator